MTKKSMGYPLPSGDAFTDDLACMLVFIPDKDEYRQAFFSAYFYLSNWIAWQNDPEKKGKDAARAWKLAVEATLECIEMNTCETILSLLTEIRDNTGIYCCDVVDISDGDQFTDEVEDGAGDVPQNIIDAGYADDAADWDGFYDYKCMISHVMVDNLKAQIETINTAIDQSGAVLIGVVALAAIAVTILTAGGALLATGIVLSLIGVTGLAAALAEIGKSALPALIDAVDDSHDALACSIYNADGSPNAVIALTAAIDDEFTGVQAAVLKNLNIPAPLKALYSGRYDQQDIAQNLADLGYDVLDYDCTCFEAEQDYLAVFDDDEELWDIFPPTNSYWNGFEGNPLGCIVMHWSNGWINIRNNEIQVGAGLSDQSGDDIEIAKITLNYKKTEETSPDQVRVIIDETGTPLTITEGVGASTGSHIFIEFTPVTPKLVEWNDPALKIRLNGGSGFQGVIDNVRVYFNVL